MVEVGEDPGVVTSRMEREMREARRERELREEMAARTAELTAQSAEEVGELCTTTEQPVPRPEPVDTEAFLRRGRLGVVAVFVLILFWAWIRERRVR